MIFQLQLFPVPLDETIKPVIAVNWQVGMTVRRKGADWQLPYQIVMVTDDIIFLRRPDSVTKAGFRTHGVSKEHMDRNYYVVV